MLLGFASVAQAYQPRQPNTNSMNGHTNEVREAPTGLNIVCNFGVPQSIMNN